MLCGDLNGKEIQKGDDTCIHIADSFEKTLMLGKIEEEKGMTEDEMVRWHHQLYGHGFG